MLYIILKRNLRPNQPRCSYNTHGVLDTSADYLGGDLEETDRTASSNCSGSLEKAIVYLA